MVFKLLFSIISSVFKMIKNICIRRYRLYERERKREEEREREDYVSSQIVIRNIIIHWFFTRLSSKNTILTTTFSCS